MSENIEKLIYAAKEAGIVSELSQSGKYISFALLGEGKGKRRYELCLEGDPDEGHPTAERAMRASDALIELDLRLGGTYNCFAVSMANIEPPTGVELARMLGVGAGVRVSEPKGEAVDRFSGEVTHMIQVVIDIFIGDSTYDTVIDNVYVNCQDDLASGGKICLFKSAGETVFDTGDTVLDKKGISIEEDKRAARALLGQLTGKHISRTYQGVLKALSEDKGSNFYKYLAGVAKTKPKMPVGRIEMRIRSLYLGAERVKQFIYTLTSRDGYSQDVKLFWNKSSTSLGKDDALYLIKEGESFVGITCERPDKGAVEFKRDVICAKTPVCADDGKYRLESRFFPRSMLKVRSCEYCPQSYYASDATDKLYREGFTLLDGTHACEACNHENMTVTRRNRKRFKYRTRAKRFSDGALGELFTEYEYVGGDSLVNIKNGGNAFLCSHCGLYIYRNEKTSPKDIPTCEICKEYVCKECFAEMRRERSAYYISGDALKSVTFCNYCKNHETVSYDGRTLRIYPAYTDSSEREEGFVLDSATKREASSLEVCGDCGRLIFTGIKKIPDGDRCVKCGAYFGGECVKGARGRHPSGATVCEACMSTLKSPEADSLFCENLRCKAEYEYGDIRTEAVRSYIQSADYTQEFLKRHSSFIRGVMGIFAARRLGGAEVCLVGGIKLRLKDASLASTPDACAADVEYRLDVKVGRAVRRFIIKAEAMLSQIENGACSVDITGERAVYGG